MQWMARRRSGWGKREGEAIAHTPVYGLQEGGDRSCDCPDLGCYERGDRIP